METGMSIHDEGTPELIYHVVQLKHWNEAQESGTQYFPPTYDSDGFIHATHDGKLLIAVLNHFYADIDDDFLCLEIRSSKLASPIKMEAPAPVGDKAAHQEDENNNNNGAEVKKFPHIYGPIEPLSTCVVRKLPVERSSDGKFVCVNGL